MKKFVAIFVLGAMVLTFSANSASAVQDFKKAFDAKYVKAEPKTDEEKALKEAVDKAKCNVCHKGKSKKEKNAYGVALGKLLKKGDAKDAEKIEKALTEVEGMKAGEKDPTFGELIKSGKLSFVE